jgi:hypothetical protein
MLEMRWNKHGNIKENITHTGDVSCCHAIFQRNAIVFVLREANCLTNNDLVT